MHSIIDEEEASEAEEDGGDTLGDLPVPTRPTIPVRPSLHGLDGIISARFGPTANADGPSSDAPPPCLIHSSDSLDSVGGRRQQPKQRGLNFDDYLRAQRALQSRRQLVGRVAVEPVSSSSPPSSLGANLKAASFAAKLRKRANQRTAEEAASNGGMDDWERMAQDMEDVEADGHFSSVNHASTLLPWYAAPVQRQRWGEDIILPHVNWGDLFFDLFYVAMAYNLGVMLMSGMNAKHWLRVAIYYVGIFGPLYMTWETSMLYASRYTSLDYAHRLFEVVRYLLVSMAVMHVNPVGMQVRFIVFTRDGLCTLAVYALQQMPSV